MDYLRKTGKEILMGNEAIVRGALEAGLQFASTYPGTPSSEIGDTFAKIPNIYFEYSTNEKVALEAGIGASMSGLKTIVSMKNFGANVASDSLMPFAYTGSNGPTVIVIADDPSCHSSAQSEENTRGFAQLAHLPILEPADPQECKDFTKLGFKLSERYKIPVILRITTRVAHQRMPVTLKSIPKKRIKPKFVRNQHKYVTMPPRVLEMKQELFDKIQNIKKVAELYNTVSRGKGSLGIITSGVSYLYVKEALKQLSLNIPVLKLGFFYPLPKKAITSFSKNLKKILVVEELEPYLERYLKRTVKPEIIGKDLIPVTGELRPEHVITALGKLLGKRVNYREQVKPIKHIPRFCLENKGSCPYWKVFAAIKKVVPKNTVIGGDIGCYSLAALPPHNLFDYVYSMGASIGVIHGISKMCNQKTIAFIGDSTFFHSGIPALINTIYNKSNPLIIIMDNKITAMTGHQPNPGTGNVKIEDILKGLKVKYKIIDPVKEHKLFERTVKQYLNNKQVSVIISRHPCWLYYGKRA